jgi:FkbM family methyltransferase
MSKLSTAISLLAAGKVGILFRQLRWHIRGRRIERARGQPFLYRRGGFPFVCIPGNFDSEVVYRSDSTEDLELSLLKSWLREDDKFIDAGANLGLYSFAVGHFLRGSGAILAIEASPELGAGLRASAKMLGVQNLTVESCIVGDGNREVIFYTARPGRPTDAQSMRPAPELIVDLLARTLKMRALSDIVAGHAEFFRPAAVKVDIEGAEPAALLGVPPEWLTERGPLWVVEINPVALARNQCTCVALAERFSAESFDRWLSPKYSRSGAPDPPLRKYTSQETFADAWIYNLIAIPTGDEWRRRRSGLQTLLDHHQRSRRFRRW